MAGFARSFNVRDEKSIYLDVDQTSTVNAGNDENTDITAPSGYMYKILSIHLYAPDPTGSTAGEHYFRVEKYNGTDRELKFLNGSSNTGDQVQFQYGEWLYATNTSAGDLADIKDQYIDDTNGIRVRYVNNTDANQTANRRIRFLVQKVRVA